MKLVDSYVMIDILREYTPALEWLKTLDSINRILRTVPFSLFVVGDFFVLSELKKLSLAQS